MVGLRPKRPWPTLRFIPMVQWEKKSYRLCDKLLFVFRKCMYIIKVWIEPKLDSACRQEKIGPLA
jgi:hypothetical protein